MRFPAAGVPERRLGEANQSARAFSSAVIGRLLPGFDIDTIPIAGGEASCCLCEPGVGELDGLLTNADLDRLVRESLHAPDSDLRSGWQPRISRSGQPVPPTQCWYQDGLLAEGRGGRLDPYRLSGALREGSSLYLRDSLAHHLPLRRLLEHFRRVFGGGGQAGVFVSYGSSPSPFGIHWDDTENFCFQLAGRRRWVVRRPSIPDNHHGLLGDDGEPGEVMWEGVLTPGQVLAVPRAWWHEVTPLDAGPSVSVTIGVNRPVAHDALRWLVAQGTHQAPLRVPLSAVGSTDGSAVLDPVRRFVAEVDDDHFLAHLNARELPIAAAGPGFLELLQVERPEDLVIRSQLTAAVTVVDPEGAGTLRLAAAGRVIEVDPAFVDIVAEALSGPPVQVRDLLERGRSPQEVVLLVDHLVKNDWCVPARVGEDPLARAGLPDRTGGT